MLEITLPLISAMIKAEVTREIRWNSFPGSVIHGIIGFRLKDISCVAPHRNCKKCFLAESCAYGVIYESLTPPDAERMKLYPQTPHPVRITVYPWDKPILTEGESFEIRITLMGKAISNFLSVLLSLESGLTGGVGRKHGGERGTAEILSVQDSITGENRDWASLKHNYANILCSDPLTGLVINSDSINLNFTSPLKVVTNGKANFKPTFRDITSTLCRRLGNLSYFFGEELNIDYKGMLSTAAQLPFDSSLKRARAIRYSSRQEKTINISGVVGEMRIENCPNDLYRLLHVGQYVGAGKSTTMGLGDYRIVKSV